MKQVTTGDTISDETKPRVVSNIRLEVHMPENRAGSQRHDPGASEARKGYAAHYCSVPQREDPGIVACSFILSGLRLFDISDEGTPDAPQKVKLSADGDSAASRLSLRLRSARSRAISSSNAKGLTK